MSYSIVMPEVTAAPKQNLPELTPILVQDISTGDISTIIIANKAVVWFEKFGEIQKSDLTHFVECSDYVVLKKYQPGDKLVVEVK